jgi:hypothetical protein
MTTPTRQRLSAAAGILYYSSAGFVRLMGIMTAETKYPIFRHYTTRREISDLGGTRPPHGLVTQPSAMIFDTTMFIAGLLRAAGAFTLWRLYRNQLLTAVSTLFGAGAFLVGAFPATRPASVCCHDRLRVFGADCDRRLQGDLGTGSQLTGCLTRQLRRCRHSLICSCFGAVLLWGARRRTQRTASAGRR